MGYGAIRRVPRRLAPRKSNFGRNTKRSPPERIWPPHATCTHLALGLTPVFGLPHQPLSAANDNGIDSARHSRSALLSAQCSILRGEP